MRIAYYLSCTHYFCAFFFLTDLGLQQHRLEDEDYIDVIDEFMEAVYTRWPHVIVQVTDASYLSGVLKVSYHETLMFFYPQFEDFQSKWAFKLLQRYRYTNRMFNDDVQVMSLPP